MIPCRLKSVLILKTVIKWDGQVEKANAKKTKLGTNLQ